MLVIKWFSFLIQKDDLGEFYADYFTVAFGSYI